MNPSLQSIALVIAGPFLPLTIFLMMLSLSLSATAQVYCYSPTRDECYLSREGFCRVYEGIPISPEDCIKKIEERKRAAVTIRCCYDAATDRAYESRSECGVREQTISLEACRIHASKRPWCLPSGQLRAIQSSTNSCPSGSITLSEEAAKPFR
jgi:hypothetical protein